MKTSLRRRTFEEGAVILIISTALVKIIGAIFKIPLSNLLGDDGFGYFSSAYDLFSPVYVIAMAGFPAAVSRIVASSVSKKSYIEAKSTLKVSLRLFTIIGILAFVLCVALAYPFVRLTDSTGNSLYGILAIAPSFFFCCIISAYRGYFEGLSNMYPTAVSDVIMAVCKLFAGYGFAYLTLKITHNTALSAAAAIMGITLGTAISLFYLIIRYKSNKNELPTENGDNGAKGITAKALLIIAIPIAAAALSGSITVLIDAITVKWQLYRVFSSGDMNDVLKNLGYSAKELPNVLYGIRSKAFTIYNLVPSLTAAIGVSVLPALAGAKASCDSGKLIKNINSGLKFSAVVSFPAGLGLSALASPIMSLLFNTTASVQIGAPLMRIYGVAAVFAGVSVTMISMLQSLGKQKQALIHVIIGAFIKIAVNISLSAVKELNISGCAYGTLAFYFYIFIADYILIIKSSSERPDTVGNFIKPIIASLLSALCAYGISSINGSSMTTVAAISAAVLVYVLALISLRTFSRKEIATMPFFTKLFK